MKKIKGFTLVECIVALAVLGIASLTMAQIYANVSLRNKNNHLVNTSLSNQMAYVEQYTGAEAVPIYFGSTTNTPDPEAADSSTTKKPPHKSSKTTQNNYITITRIDVDSGGSAVDGDAYSFPTDIFVLNSRDSNDNDSADSGYRGQDEDKYNLRYKYLIGHVN